MFQNYALFPHMSVAENVAFPLRMRGLPRREIAREVRARARHGAARRARRPRCRAQLSGGQQQRVALARALVFEPELAADGRAAGRAGQASCASRCSSRSSASTGELGITVLYVTHDQEEALTMSDRVAVLNRGRIAQLGTAEDLYERPASRFVAEFIGESNLLDGRGSRTRAACSPTARASGFPWRVSRAGRRAGRRSS